MPKALEKKLKKKASQMGLAGDRKNAYIYGTMRKMGWKPKREKNSIIDGVRFVVTRKHHGYSK